MLERLYEDATSFGFPEERFERVYREVEVTLYRDAVRALVIAPLRGAWMEIGRIELGDGLSLVRGDAAAPARGVPEAARPGSVRAGARRPRGRPDPSRGAADRFAAVVTALRLWAPGIEPGGAGLAPDRSRSLAAAPARLGVPRGWRVAARR